MSGWDGRGLPPIAKARVDRFASSGLRTSLLSVPGAVGAEVAGFTSVGEVMGCVVARIGWDSGLGATTSQQMSIYARAVRTGYTTALARLGLEAETLGADGVLGISCTVTPLDGLLREFVALGTAVKADTAQRPGRLFTTGLPGQDVAKLMRAGWVPAAFTIGVGARAVYDYSMRTQTTMLAGNVEVDAATWVVSESRADARQEFHRAVRDSGADGGIVSDMTLDTWSFQDFGVAAMAGVYGTAIARFHDGPSAPTSALTILPLDRI